MVLDDITATSPCSWKYVAEGGATMVFSYVGPKNKSFDGMVLRLRKVPAVPIGLADAEGSANDVKGQEKQKLEEEPDDPVAAFQILCMTHLVPSCHLPRLETIFVSGSEAGSWLRALSDLHDASRPLSRRKLGGIDTRRPRGVLATDLVGGESGMSVEIKPKWSFLPNPAHLSVSTRDVKTRTCRFCMHTHMRAQDESQARGSVPSDGLQEQSKDGDAKHHHGSSYCPLDLFSGSQSRIRHALCSLYDTWVESDGKANNLKVFVKGKAIGASEKHLMLEPDTSAPDISTSEPDTSIDTSIREAFVNALLPYLTTTSILRVLNRLQRSLDSLDIEGLRRVWDQWHLKRELSSAEATELKDIPPIGKGIPEPTVEDWSAFIDEYLLQQKRHEKTSGTELAMITSEHELQFYLLAYLLSATFKDCSIIVRMPTLLGREFTNEGAGEQIVDPSRVALIDLDPKSMARLRKWEKLDREIVEVYRNTGEGKICVDDWCMESSRLL